MLTDSRRFLKFNLDRLTTPTPQHSVFYRLDALRAAHGPRTGEPGGGHRRSRTNMAAT